jgi:hypothetical protein
METIKTEYFIQKFLAASSWQGLPSIQTIHFDQNLTQAGAELCQAQFKLGLVIQEVRLSATKYPFQPALYIHSLVFQMNNV